MDELSEAEYAKKIARIKQIEEKIQPLWEEKKVYEAEPVEGKPKKFVTFPYPYMNGPLHVGHALSSTRVDVYARYMRLQGYNVLYPFAWHWTGEPIVGLAKRVAKGEQKTIDILTKVDGVPTEHLSKFTDPFYVANYYTAEGKKVVKRLGLSIDWRREFTTAHNEGYSRFVAWQYLTLREKGYIVKGTHPVVWCPNDKSPTGDHDRAEGEGVSPDEMSLVKFRLLKEDAFLVAATYRPETIFGATNLWVNPKALYVEALVDGERWIVSEYAAKVLPEQKHVVKVIRSFLGEELLLKEVETPLTARRLPVLPAEFVDPTFGTGVVYSVPAHAPYDYLALNDLKNKELSSELRKVVEEIRPISIISVSGYGDFPAIEECKRLGVESQKDPKAEKATENVYKLEYNKGVMKENCGKYSGKRVSDAKVEIFNELLKMGLGAVFYDTPKPVICRCGTRCIVKILEDQWFLKYGDPSWKAQARKALSLMKIFPEEARQWFLDVIEWLQDKPCTRKSGMGTPLPWDTEWIIETLSDSTVYMAYYTVSKYVNQNLIKPSQLTKEFFDYVFLGVGDLTQLSTQIGLSKELIQKVRQEFLYWYPVDLRNSAKELIANHLTFFIFHHCALFPENLWPKAISVNGLITVNGEPMHKSKGNYVSIKAALEKYGADVSRCTLINGTESLDDPDWNDKAALNMVDKIHSFIELVAHIGNGEPVETLDIDKWLLARLKQRAKEVAQHLEEMRTRSAFNIAFFEVWEDYKRYLKRCAKPNTSVQRMFIAEWSKLLHPFMPHVAQWAYNELGFHGLIEQAKYPDTQITDEEALLLIREEYLIKIEEDLTNLMRMMQGSNELEIAYATSKKRYVVLSMINSKLGDNLRVTPEMIERLSEITKEKSKAGAIAQKIIKLIAEWKAYPREWVAKMIERESEALCSFAPYLERVYGLKVKVVDEEHSEDQKRASLSLPLKPSLTLKKGP
ncbi:leucine--tRNA ligase [Candidatus Marsarchaeota G1 archaeon OSP_D]|uniref:Leucine--tRNA ligase n=2 Tax=Candidatus Marsarchaeota group 1 TaxID=2203770 RepID=A0A2R6AE23_9ARCH|nr:MAG: leucine--tRNA ligase [Candidatus Marsarchaeota G1 archaeon OSP_D]